MIGKGGHLAVPHLNGVPAKHQMAFGVQPAARLGLSLLEAGIAEPGDWRPRDKNPIDFVEKTLGRWVLKRGGEEISTEFNVALALVSDLEPYAEGNVDAGIVEEMFIVLEPETAAYVVLGPLLRELNAIHRRVPVTFFQLFTAALNRWVRVYDYRDAGERVEMLREWYEGDPEAEPVELPDVQSATPDCLQQSKPLSEGALEKLAGKTRDKRLGAILRGVLELSAASRRSQRPEIGPEASELRIPMKWGTYSGASGAASKQATLVNLDFHFDDLQDNLLTSSDAFIDAGSNVMKTLRRSAPNG